MKALTKKILIASVAVGVMTPFTTWGGVVSAAEDVQPSNPSSENTVELNESDYVINGERTSHDGTFSEFDAGFAENDGEDASNNNLTVNGGRVTTFLNGGYSRGTGNTNYNTVIINGGTFDYWVEGGWANYGDANYNTMTISGGTFNNVIVDGGYTVTGDTNYNTVTINGGVFNNNSGGYSGIYGGYVAGSGNAIGNTINIYGGTISGNIYGGYIAGSGTVADNSINIYGSPDLTNANIIAARSATSSSNNSVNIYTSEITAQNISGFENLNFYLPSTTVNGTHILTLTDSSGTDLGQTTLNVYKDGASLLNNGDTVYLVTNNNGLSFSDVTTSGKLYQGVSVENEMNLTPIDSNGKTVSMAVTFGAPKMSDNTKAFAQAPIANYQLSNIMNDKMVDWLPPIDFDELEDGQEDSDDPPAPPEVIEPKGYEIFMNMGFAKLKTKTGDNSEVETKGQNYDLGAARVLQQGSGPLYIAPVFQYGQGDYDTYLPSGIHGQGKNKFFMGGIIARKMNNNGFYYEGSFRGGKAKNDFYSDDFKLNGEPVRVSYNTSAPVFAGHIKLGKNMRLNKNNLLDIYGIYFYTRQNGVGADLSTGEHYDFSSSTSHRVKIGYRLTTRTSKISRIYTEMAYQYERCSDISATYANLSTPQVGDRGSSGMFQVGWLIKPSAKVPLMLDLNATGWVGHQRGLTASVKFKRAF